MKSLVTLLLVLLDELGEYCAVSTRKDAETLLSRSEAEGLPFLTVRLPALCLDLERGLADGRLNIHSGFKTRGELPVFLGGFFELIFDRATGTLLDEPDVEAIRSLRQLLLVYKKIELECSPDSVRLAYAGFIQSDTEVAHWEKRADIDQLVRFYELSQLVFSSVFRSVDLAVADWALTPKHGPGATADRIVANDKFEFRTWTERLESVLPFWRYATTSGYSSSRYQGSHFWEPGTEPPVKVVDVPKTMVTPRIIAEEPSHMMWGQQALASEMTKGVNGSYLVHLIGTGSQEPNQLLALEGSREGNLATLDLSEASDRVSNLLVDTLFSGFPHLQDAIRATRSLTADVAGYGVIPLHRYASMGSALCFPVEEMVFLIITLMGIEDAQGTRFRSTAHIKRLIGRVRIYGDDIIVPVEYTASVIASLKAHGLKVNMHKSFWTGQFRESCGKEYYNGDDVTVARLRRALPATQKDVQEMVGLVSFRNNLYWRGLWKTAAWIDGFVSEIIPFPVVSVTSEVLGRESVLLPEGLPLCRNLHVPLVGGMVVRYRRRLTPIDGNAALMKTLNRSIRDDPDTGRPEPEEPYGPFNTVITERDHLVYAGRPEAAALHFRRRPF